MKRGTRGVQKQVGQILPDGKTDFVLGACFREVLQPPAGLHAFHHCFFDDALAVGHRKQRGVQAVAGNGKNSVFRQQIAPGDGTHAFKQRVESRRREAPELQQHTLAAAQREVCLCTVRQGARKEHAPVLSPDFGEVHAAEFVRNQTLEPEQAGNAVLEET